MKPFFVILLLALSANSLAAPPSTAAPFIATSLQGPVTVSSITMQARPDYPGYSGIIAHVAYTGGCIGAPSFWYIKKAPALQADGTLSSTDYDVFVSYAPVSGIQCHALTRMTGDVDLGIMKSDAKISVNGVIPSP